MSDLSTVSKFIEWLIFAILLSMVGMIGFTVWSAFEYGVITLP